MIYNATQYPAPNAARIKTATTEMIVNLFILFPEVFASFASIIQPDQAEVLVTAHGDFHCYPTNVPPGGVEPPVALISWGTKLGL